LWSAQLNRVRRSAGNYVKGSPVSSMLQDEVFFCLPQRFIIGILYPIYSLLLDLMSELRPPQIAGNLQPLNGAGPGGCWIG
jgi:hypothetical protein